MENLFTKKVPLYYETEESQLILGDSFKILTKMEPESVDMIFADPPYFLSNDGITCQGGKMVSVNKGSWDKLSESGTSVEEKHKFNRKWIKLCKKVLKPNGTIWISGTLHNIYSIGMALEQEGFKIINNITWQKTNPPPNLACRCFTHSTETILWAKKNDKKSRHFFNYQKMKEWFEEYVHLYTIILYHTFIVLSICLQRICKETNHAEKLIFSGSAIRYTAEAAPPRR